MKKFSNAALAGAILLASGTFAFAENEVAATPEKKAEITEFLKGKGYEVRNVKVEDGLFEAYTVKDGVKEEIFLDADMNIVRTKKMN